MIVKVFVTSPDTRSERRLNLDLSIEQLKVFRV
jgi:Ubiquitin-like domain